MNNTVWIVTSNDLGQVHIVMCFDNATAAERFRDRKRAEDKFRYYESKSYHLFQGDSDA